MTLKSLGGDRTEVSMFVDLRPGIKPNAMASGILSGITGSIGAIMGTVGAVAAMKAATGVVALASAGPAAGRCGGGGRGLERGMLEQPDLLGRLAGGDGGDTVIHFRERALVVHRPSTHPPLHRRRAGRGLQRRIEIGVGQGADINHSFTIPC